MIKRFIILAVCLLLSKAYGYEFPGYVSPESYAINESDLRDYMYVPSTPRPTIDNLDNNMFDKKTGIIINQAREEAINTVEPQTARVKRAKGEKKPYEQTLTYKAAKWWVDKRYQREEPHHGAKHEIKTNSKNK